MTNASKDKGDRFEREAVAMLKDLCPDLCLDKAKRMLGAGRAEDVGDLYVFADVAVQVRAYKMTSIGGAIRSSAKDSITQAGHGDMPYALGLVPYPGARAGTVRWIACVEQWPVELPIEPIPFAMVGKALAWLRDDNGPHGFMAYPRTRRIGVLAGGSTKPVLMTPVEAWVAAYREATGRLAPVLDSAAEAATGIVLDFPAPAGHAETTDLEDTAQDESGPHTEPLMDPGFDDHRGFGLHRAALD